jgi:hypothetical protein
VTRVDTLVVRDTIRDTVPVPRTRHIVRIDTVWLRSVDEKSPADSIKVETPIEQKIYQTDDYRAVVEGFRPALVEMEIYRNTLHIDRETHTTTTITPRPKRWGIGIQIGYGYAPTAVATGRNFHPYVGIGAQYNIIMW